jgi:pyruvate/2-oxoglutarate dehydrogenase complex dihydrolipoamide acyltransferase (E2) component
LLAILAPGGTVRVGQVVGWIGAPGEHIPLPAEGVADTTAVSPRDMASGAPAPAPGPPASTAAFATPAARRRAQELNLDIRSVTGTGPGGRITQEDVERQASRPT